MRCLSVFLLGSPRIEQDETVVVFDTRKAVALLAYLAITEESHQRERLATLLWPDYDQAHAMGALRRTLSALKKSLQGKCLHITREAVSLDPAVDVWLDISEFRRLMTETQSHGHAGNQVCPRCIPLLEDALAIYRDDFMAGFSLRDSIEFDDWQFFQQDSLRRELKSLLEQLVQGYAAQSRYSEAIDIAKRQIALDPLDEPAHRQLMQLYAQSQQYNLALRQYQECSRILEAELGVAPLEETTNLFIAIKEQRSESSSEARPVQVVAAAHSTPVVQKIPLVGREQDMQALQTAYNSVRDDGTLMFISGEAGIGKTRLVEEFLTQMRTQGVVTITARCYAGENSLAYAPVIDALRMAVRTTNRPDWKHDVPELWMRQAALLLPELGGSELSLSSGPLLSDPGAQIRFYEGIIHVLIALCGSTPAGVLFFDDLHWADEATIDFLTYTVRRLRGRPIMLLATWTTSDLAANNRLKHLFAEAKRNDLAGTLELSRLRYEAVENLVVSVVGDDAGILRMLSERLYHESEGSPFFITEYLATLPEDIAPILDEPWSLPAGVRELLQVRLGGVDEAGIQLLQTAAVIGHSFDFDILHEASGRTEEETLITLDLLLARGLIRETRSTNDGSGTSVLRSLVYDFNHDKLRELVFSEISQTRRRLLHQRVAQAITTHARSPREQRVFAGQIAFHLRQGGRAQEAAAYYAIAGEHSRLVYANAEALVHFQSALALGHPDTAALDESIGDMYVLLGDYGSALRSYATAGAYYPTALKDLARIEHKLGELCSRIGDWSRAESHFSAAAEVLTQSEAAANQSRLFADWSRMEYRRGKMERAQQMASRSLDLAAQAVDNAALAQAYDMVGILTRVQGQVDEAIHHFETSLNYADSENDPGARIAALNNLSLSHADRQDMAQARNYAKQALDLCISIGDRHREAALHNNLADLFHASGDQKEAMAHLKEAVKIFSEIGISEDESAPPEVWKLMEW